MGVLDVQGSEDAAELRLFTWQLIQDVRALEYMLREQMFDQGPRRIGAEQELFLIDRQWQPAPLAEEILKSNPDPRIVTELTRFNLELNLQPYVFEGDCLRQLEQQIDELLDLTRELANKEGAEVLMTGILPTIHLTDLTLDNMAPKPRYFALNDAIMRLRGGPAQFQIRGVDELFFRHDSILVEGCNTSFQTHFQVSPSEFPHLYNIAQVVAAPVLAASTNSPILFGKRLWQETRIALFQQAVDTRSANLYLREMSPRVHFGTDWIRESVAEIYKEDIARFRVILTAEAEDPFEVLAEGGIPSLKALLLHNGTVYRWNRACYGVMNGVPHLRIENRILPSGPTVIDEVANAAFWFGLVSGLASIHDDVTELIEFDDAKNNFVGAARVGLDAHLYWLDGKRHPAPDLILNRLTQIAREGLSASGIEQADIDRYIGVIEDRVRSRMTGARWQLDSVASMRKNSPESTRADRLNALVAGTLTRQKDGTPVHAWDLASLDEVIRVRNMQGTRVEHFMSTDLFTVNENELVELVACLMDWRRIRHVLVEDESQSLVGLVTHRNLLRYVAEHGSLLAEGNAIPVKEIMIRNPVSVAPETRTVEALQIMREKKIGALPVVRDGQLVGIITERDFYNIAGQLLDDSMIAPVRPDPEALS